MKTYNEEMACEKVMQAQEIEIFFILDLDNRYVVLSKGMKLL